MENIVTYESEKFDYKKEEVNMIVGQDLLPPVAFVPGWEKCLMILEKSHPRRGFYRCICPPGKNDKNNQENQLEPTRKPVNQPTQAI